MYSFRATLCREDDFISKAITADYEIQTMQLPNLYEPVLVNADQHISYWLDFSNDGMNLGSTDFVKNDTAYLAAWHLPRGTLYSFFLIIFSPAMAQEIGDPRAKISRRRFAYFVMEQTDCLALETNHRY